MICGLHAGFKFLDDKVLIDCAEPALWVDGERNAESYKNQTLKKEPVTGSSAVSVWLLSGRK